VAGLGEDRRVHHRRAVADTIRRLRTEKGWTQEELADRLHTDRRQVVRLEAAQAPVTLELIEALGIGLQTPSLFFMTSLATSEAVDEDAIQGLTRRMAVDEMRKRFGASLDRSGIAAVVRNAELLDDEQLWVLVIVADALFKAGVLEEQDDDDEWPRLLRAASRHTTTRRRGGIDKEGKR
jgi:transcriptional regulator with XRE-family HTH domain